MPWRFCGISLLEVGFFLGFDKFVVFDYVSG